LQRTFADFGFHPAAYFPAIVSRGSDRLDVIKMMMLNTLYSPGSMKLTEASEAVVEIVQKGFLSSR
jgi:hypothetical protein